ncbi:hypothetical protein GGX14DRAFT_701378 [Mycena pura]|uniref:DUF6699 domain-containing protein n=1 Tax=Mycena pura TaxID=153505 RepID=A0AAD6UUP4_9AGAR|nr:hypothetical protein GGX14DRAFT_701378 [Mycena pura]
MSPKPKNVHWKLAVEEYAACDSPESWTSPLPSVQLPPTPQLRQDLPLLATPGPSLDIHPALTPAHALQLDFSFPSAAFRGNPQLTDTLLDAPACTPPRRALVVRIASGLYKKRVEIRAGGRGGGAVTVGDVLTAVQRHLREYDAGPDIPRDAAPYAARRVATVNGFCSGRPARTQLAHIRAEQDGGPRIVDRLLGHTLFAGLAPMLGQPDHHWQLELAVPPRYAA